MPSLREMQTRFAEALHSPQTAMRALNIRAQGLVPSRRLRIYRNNYVETLTQALRVSYPVVVRLVGRDFFDAAMCEYLRRHSSQNANLRSFGAQLADFLSVFPPASGLPYLPDVARLEWACQVVYHAPEALPLGSAALSTLLAIPTGRQPQLRARLHPASRLLASPYPVLHIWQANQPDADSDAIVRLDRGGSCLLVMRRGAEIEIEEIDSGAFALLAALDADATLEQACAAACAARKDFNLSACLQLHVRRGTVVGFE